MSERSVRNQSGLKERGAADVFACAAEGAYVLLPLLLPLLDLRQRRLGRLGRLGRRARVRRLMPCVGPLPLLLLLLLARVIAIHLSE